MNEGFKALPEYVQRKIDPEAAEKFMGGGSVMQRPLFRQMGGPAAPPMMGMAPPQVNPEQVAQVQNMEDRAMGQGEELGQAYASEMITNIDAADDAKSLIDAFRGNEKPLEARYAELAGYVGEADANRTPESVLTMVQPTIMMTEEGAVDSGIGELMQSLVQDVGMAEGEQMSQGVGELMAMGAGNTPPVNFNQGGAVRHYAPGGAVASGAQAYLPQFQELYSSVLGDPAQRQAQLDEQKRLTQAQMLFDIAQAGLQFAGTTEGNTIAERLANAAAQSQVFPRIGERAAGQLQAKQALEAEKRQMDLAALQSSIAASQSDVSAKQAMDLAAARASSTKSDFKRLVGSDGEIINTFNLSDPEGLKLFTEALEKDPQAIAYNLGTEARDTGFKTIKLFDPSKPTEPPKEYPINTPDQRKMVGELMKDGFTSDDTFFAAAVADEYAQLAEQRAEEKDIRAEDRADVTYQNRYDQERADKLADIDASVARDIAEEERKLGYTLQAEERANFEFDRRFKLEVAETIRKEELALDRKLSDEERANVEFRSRLAVQEQMDIRKEARAIANRDNVEIRTIDNQIVAVNKETNETVVLFGTPTVPDPVFKEITLPNAQGNLVTTVVDINSPQGKAAIDKVNEVSAKGGQASMRNIATANITPRGFLIPEEGVFTSYDGGQTYVDGDGNVKSVPGGAFEVSNTIAYDVSKNEKIRANALKQLADMDINISSGVVGEDGQLLDAAGQKEVVDAYEAARNGTGFWAKILAGVDAVVGGVTGGKLSVRIDKQDARQFVRMVRVLGRSSLAASPRFAVADLQTTEQLFPNEQSLIANPETEARKLISLKSAINEEKTRILTLFASGTPVDSTMRKTLNQKLFEINRLNQMLGSVDTIFAGEATADALNEAKNLIKQSVGKKGGLAGGGNE